MMKNEKISRELFEKLHRLIYDKYYDDNNSYLKYYSISLSEAINQGFIEKSKLEKAREYFKETINKYSEYKNCTSHKNKFNTLGVFYERAIQALRDELKELKFEVEINKIYKNQCKSLEDFIKDNELR